MPKFKKKEKRPKPTTPTNIKTMKKTHLSAMLAFADERYTTFSVWVFTDSVDHNHLHSC